MPVYGGPKIIEDGLIFQLDAGNSKCFTSGETIAIDLVQKILCTGANGTPYSGTHTPNPSNFPIYNSMNEGVFNFSGGKGINVESNLGSHSEITTMAWLYKNSTGTQYVFDARNNNGQWWLTNYSSYNINWHSAMQYNFDGSYVANPVSFNFINSWFHCATTSDSSGSKLYINGILVHSDSSLNENLGINFRIGTRYTTSGPWTGYMGPIKIYNKVLTADDILWNYNILKGRFGLI